MDVRAGLRCLAPVKVGKRARELHEVEVVWVSRDGRVVEAQTVRRKRPIRSAFAASVLKPIGSPRPAGGVFV